MKDLLFLAYHFPPAQNGAVARFHAYYKYLRNYGYNPIIVTVNNLEQLEAEENIFRFDSFSTLMRKPWWRRYSLKWSKKMFYDIFDPTLDYRWRYHVKKNIDEVIKKYNFSAVVGSFPNTESLYLAHYISKKYNIPLISEFRDGYAHESILANQKYFQSGFIKIFESKIVKSSKYIFTVTDTFSDYFRNHYGIDTVSSIYNGYIEDDFNEVDKVDFEKKDEKVRFINFGSIDASGKRDVSFMYLAINKLKEEQIINENNFELTLIGRYSKKELDFIKNLKLENLIKVYPQMTKIDGFKKIRKEYDYLLLYGLPGISHNIPSKAFEYIRLGKPILGICKGNESEKLIKSTSTGEVCDFDTDEAAALFKKFVKGKVNYNPNKEVIDNYNRKKQVERFASALYSMDL